jgi:hypothetical protein
MKMVRITYKKLSFHAQVRILADEKCGALIFPDSTPSKFTDEDRKAKDELQTFVQYDSCFLLVAS